MLPLLGEIPPDSRSFLSRFSNSPHKTLPGPSHSIPCRKNATSLLLETPQSSTITGAGQFHLHPALDFAVRPEISLACAIRREISPEWLLEFLVFGCPPSQRRDTEAMRPPRPIQGRLKSFSVETTQGFWDFDVSVISGVAQPPAAADGQPQPSACPQQNPRPAILVKNKNIPPARSVQQSHAEPSHTRDLPETNDDDDDAFMEPPPRRPVLKKQCTNASVPVNAVGKRGQNVVKYAHAPTARCAPSQFNAFFDHLTFNQRMCIKEMGFGGLLNLSAEKIGSRELLKFLFDRLDPNSMVIEVGKGKRISITHSAYQIVVKIYLYKEIIRHPRLCQISRFLLVFKNFGICMLAISRRYCRMIWSRALI